MPVDDLATIKMESFDVFCLWLGRIVLFGSALFIAILVIGLLISKVLEKTIGKKAMMEKQALMEEVRFIIGWHKDYIQEKEEKDVAEQQTR